MKHAILTALAATALASCTTWVDQPMVDASVIREAGPVALGEAQRVGDLYVTPLRVIEDSRCPQGVQCVWAGTVKVETRVDGAGWRETSVIGLGTPASVRGHAIELAEVSPSARQENIPPADYRLLFR